VTQCQSTTYIQQCKTMAEKENDCFDWLAMSPDHNPTANFGIELKSATARGTPHKRDYRQNPHVFSFSMMRFCLYYRLFIRLVARKHQTFGVFFF